MPHQLARVLKNLRQDRGWTLDRLAAASSLSRATLSRLENGQVSPTVEALSALGHAFGLSASRLLAMAEDDFGPLVPYADQKEAEDPRTGFAVRIVSPMNGGLSADVVECHLPSGRSATDAAVTAPGREHHLVLLDGALTVLLEGGQHDLTAGDCLRFHPSAPAEFETGPNRGARFLVLRV
ncbi:helix-turn-helix domain-containing protein [Jhaorihella thermophila]|uniref:Helix-turn-helix domain-containing protein n=1 Tax=Jhaorihella thermophila TaxID=488547 RepID=A0A1H5VG23_9RHOB|nr:helix-turn-helix transcriptional regulator [Jhaorihella thermophila]SEF86213.1 Helix-turn-helix domain-containing protein [Jhaorihella thermophila]